MINEMAHFAVLLRRISKEIYHNSKDLTMPQKSDVAMQLDALLDEWMSRLPQWLDFNVVSFREAEWAAKQKLVLQLRYLNARIILHRPFLAQPTSRGQSETQKHVDLCLDAARKTIRLLYDSYANRHYFRTWWYNSTYTLCAGMIVLYVIMLGHTTLPSNDLLDDVKRSRDILRSMEESSVARRSTDLMSEVLEVAQACTQQRRYLGPDELGAPLDGTEYHRQTDSHELSYTIDDYFARNLFSHTDLGQDPGALLASLLDPNVLQDFTAESNDFTGLDFSTLPVHGGFDDILDGQIGLVRETMLNLQDAGGTDHSHEVFR